MVRFAPTLALVALTSGCFSTSYTGRDPRKVYMTMEDSMRGYTRGGEFYSELGFGGGLLDAVGSNPRAREEAQTFRDRMILGFVAILGGTVCVPVALTYGATRGDEENHDFYDAAGYVALGCVGVMLIGGLSVASAVPHQLDAINIYNDDVDASMYAPAQVAPIPYAPGAPVAPPVAPPAAPPMGPGGQP